MLLEDFLEDLPDQTPPSDARCVRDLLALVGDNQRARFRGSTRLSGSEPPFFKVSAMGGYVNHGLPKIVPQPKILEWPTPARSGWVYRPVSSLGDYRVKYDGPPQWMSDLYRVATTLFLVSEKVLQLILERDPAAIETSKATIEGAHASAIGPYWVVMPCRVFDAIDVSKSCVLLKRPETVRGSGKFVTHVAYEKGYVFRDDLPAEICCFFEEFGSNAGWFWRYDLIQAAADAGARGLHFGYGQVDLSHEIKLRGPNDPSSW